MKDDFSGQVVFSVAEALALEEIAAGDPAIVAGDTGVGRTVRWAHVVAGESAFALLDGGELVLTTGAGWPHSDAALRSLAQALTLAEPAAVLLELGEHFREAPAPLVRACEAHAIPLVVLQRQVRFVQITQRVHQRILTSHTEALAARAEVHTMLTELGLNRSPVDYVVQRLSQTLGAPVVLEDSAHRVVAWSAPGLGPEEVLGLWAGANPREFGIAIDLERVPVEAQGTRWGYLTALQGPAHAAGRRTVLELGAFALALGRLAGGERDQWLQHSSKQLFEALLGGRYRHEIELSTQLSAAGLPVDGRSLLGATLHGVGSFGSHASLERAVLETALRRAIAPNGRVIMVPDPESPSGSEAAAPLLALLSFPMSDAGAESIAHRLAEEIEAMTPSTTPTSWRAHLSLGATGTGVRSLITSLETVRAAGRLRPTTTLGRVTVQQAERQPLAYLVRGLAGSTEVQEFASGALGPLLEHDATVGPGHSGDLIEVLRAYLDHPSNRSLAARQARLSRSVFYQRLALIERLLGADLTDGTTIATLTVALLARG